METLPEQSKPNPQEIKDQKKTVPEVLKEFTDEERIGYITFLLEEKESAGEIQGALDNLKEAVGEEKAEDIFTKAKEEMEVKQEK